MVQLEFRLKDSFYDFIIGNLLGDGSLFRDSKGSIRYCHGSKTYEFLSDYIVPKLNGFGLKTKNIRELKYSNGKIAGFSVRTHNYFGLFFPLYKLWYPASKRTEGKGHYYVGKKKIKKNDIKSIKLNPTICREWYIGDGCLAEQKTGPSYIILCADSFPRETTNYLYLQLQNIGFKATMHKTRIGYRIKIKPESTKAFLDYIGCCPESIVGIYGYKWDSKSIINGPDELNWTAITDKEKDKIRQLYSYGMTCGGIGKEIKRHIDSVRNVLKKEGLFKKGWNRASKLLLRGLKECSCCKQVKETKDFYVDCSNKDRLTIMCKQCRSQYERAWKQNKSPNINCDKCGKAFYKKPCRIERSRKHFCSDICGFS